MERDLTVGSVPKQLLSFAAPLFLANLLQSLYSIVDMAVVGRFVGSAGLAAVSSAAMLSFIIQSVCTGVTTGGAVLIAQYKARATRAASGKRPARSFRCRRWPPCSSLRRACSPTAPSFPS